ncbi:MAG: TetR/AcrR family transcriptional regulator [Clostridia bacterium]
MVTTKEKILTTALQLFSKDGYEAVSVSMIAGILGMTKGALYKHYASKRDIFDSIIARMEKRDAQRATEFKLPVGTLAEMTEQYCSTSVNQLIEYSKAQFVYWTQEAFPSAFRKMLTLEQYRSEEMNRLYQQYLASGPLGYVTDLFGSLGIENPQREAVNFYAPMFLLYSVYDGSADKAAAMAQMEEHFNAARQHLLGENK